MKPDQNIWPGLGRELDHAIMAYKDDNKPKCRKCLEMARRYIDLIVEWTEDDPSMENKNVQRNRNNR